MCKLLLDFAATAINYVSLSLRSLKVFSPLQRTVGSCITLCITLHYVFH